MDSEQDEFAELNDDDEKARRILSLALEFMNTGQAISSTRIAQDIYPGLSPTPFERRSRATARTFVTSASCSRASAALARRPVGLQTSRDPSPKVPTLM